MISILPQFEKQEHTFQFSPSAGVKVWTKALDRVLAEYLKFALNSTVENLPYNANLHQWRKDHSSACPLCVEKQNLNFTTLTTAKWHEMSGGKSLYMTLLYHSLLTFFQLTYQHQCTSALTWILMPGML